VSFAIEWQDRAERQLDRLAQRNPEIAQDIFEKVEWLAKNIADIDHEKMHGHAEHSLHSGQYRILYSIDQANERIVIADIDKHDAAYRRLKRR
jgi:mRNA-degrading endonuclease RelE of RelBE toxin-antitoxin system